MTIIVQGWAIFLNTSIIMLLHLHKIAGLHIPESYCDESNNVFMVWES
jgi:hypothetical protein